VLSESNPTPVTPPVIEQTPAEIASQQRLMRVRELWTKGRADQLEIGRLLYDERAERLGVGGQGCRDGFHQWLRDAGVPKNSAYRRIAEYEISIGERSEDDPFDKPRVPKLAVPNGTGTVEVPNIEPVEPAPVNPTEKKPVQSVQVPIAPAVEPVSESNAPVGEPVEPESKAIPVLKPVRTEYDKGYADGHAEALHKVAALRFKAEPSKCYQRHIREVYAEIEGREQITTLDGAVVETTTNEEGANLIHKYEWLQTMGAGTIACYGLKLNGELLGVACFGKGGSTEARDIIEGEEDRTICLMRGACVPWAPENAGSFLVRRACRQAHKDYGWTVFFAYSDSDAGEIGTVYQAVGWKYIGVPKAGKHVSFTKDGETISSYQFNRKSDSLFQSLGWDGVQGKYDFLRADGWTEVLSVPKKKYVWFESKRLERQKLIRSLAWEVLPYPKRDESIPVEPDPTPAPESVPPSPMTLEAAEKLAIELMAKHGLKKWKFEFDNSKRRFGACHYRAKRITLSRHIVLLNGEAETRDTILHEIAHALAPKNAHHNAEWKRIALSLGCDGTRCYDHTVKTPSSKYLAFCKHCGRVTEYSRMRDLSCGKCSNGTYSPKYRLIIRDRTEIEEAGGIEEYKRQWLENNIALAPVPEPVVKNAVP
jgi:predicted SprT family Zn-dependent metalloprotease